MEEVMKIDLVGFDTNHGHRHSFLVILEYSNTVWSTYILEIALTASNLSAVLKRERICVINSHC